MSKFLHATMVGSMLACCSLPNTAYAAPAVTANENMVSLPTEDNIVMVPDPVALPDNMVYVSDPLDDPELFKPLTGRNYVEAGINTANVSNNYGDWFGQFVKGEIQTDNRNRWNGILQHQEAYHDDGWFVGAGNTHTIDEDWFSRASLGVGSSTTFFPRFRADADINNKTYNDLVLTGGVGFSASDDNYQNYNVLLAASYYFIEPWVFQAGTRLGVSSPGGVFNHSQFAAVTYGYTKRFYLVARAARSREAYEILNGGGVNQDFNSHTFGGSWRQWLGEDWGFNIDADYYHNPFYNRMGYAFSVFREF